MKNLDIPLSRRYRLSRYLKRFSNLLAYYPLDETSGLVALNLAPSTKGTLDGTITGATVGQPGKVGRAYSFDGVNDEITRGLISNDATDVSTLIMFKSDDYTQNRQGLWSHGNATGGYALVLSGNLTTDGSLFILHHVIAWHDTTVNIQNNNWNMLLFTRNAAANNVKIYLNGSQIYSANASLGVPATTTFVGSDDVGFFKGKLQHWAFIQKELTAAEALKLARIVGLA